MALTLSGMPLEVNLRQDLCPPIYAPYYQDNSWCEPSKFVCQEKGTPSIHFIVRTMKIILTLLELFGKFLGQSISKIAH